MGFPIQTLIVQKANSKKHKVTSMDAPVQLVNPDGTAFSGGSAAAPDLSGYAKKTDIPTVPKGAAVAYAADAPTKDEFNALLKSLRDAGIIAD
jgi:hypothetical protein